MANTNIQEVTLSVPDISCQHCVHTINTTLGAINGVEKVNTDIPTKSVTLSYDPQKVDLGQVKEALDDAGYTVAQ
jgi:copper chaperone